MNEDSNEEINQLSAEQEVARRLDKMSSRLDRLEALQEDERRHWESLVEELIKTRMFVRDRFKA